MFVSECGPEEEDGLSLKIFSSSMLQHYNAPDQAASGSQNLIVIIFLILSKKYHYKDINNGEDHVASGSQILSLLFFIF